MNFKKPMKSGTRNFLIWGLIFLTVIALAQLFQAPSYARAKVIAFSDFAQEVKKDTVLAVTLQHQEVAGTLKDGTKFITYLPPESGVVPLLEEHGVSLTVLPDDEGEGLASLVSWLPLVIFLVFWFLMMRQMASTNGKALMFGKSKAKLMLQGKTVTFKDVAGIDEARQELEEVVEFLKSPKKFQRLGGKIPKGVLLIGPPGTGKTLLAKAIAGEAKVPFFTISGSDFVEMFVGVGASRVRDMFEQAKSHSPCIVFVDEIDAVGRHRGAGLGGGNDEREQTLNQLLVEMDGFEENSGIILIAATNRPDVLDPALLRPGRFDRQIVVSNPDVKGREAILEVHVRKVPLAEDVKLSVLARGTPGFSGADLANLVNEGALLAARRDHLKVSMQDLEDAKDKVMMGSERKSLVMDAEEKKMTAYHEAGHAIVSLHLPETDPLHKVTIIPRGRALGVTMQLPEKDKYSQSKTYLTSRLAILFGGRVAEELVLGPEHVSTGASNDIQVATSIARKMVAEWGLSSLGPIAYEEPQGEVFLGYDISRRKAMADKTALAVDEEIKAIICRAYETARSILQKNKKQLDLLAEGLIEHETLTGEEVQKVIIGKTLQKNAQAKAKARPTLPIDRKAQAGRTMVEMLGVICIIGVLTVAAFNGINYTMINMRVSKAHNDIEEMASNITKMYAWSRTYAPLNMVDLCANDILPEKCMGTLNAQGVCTGNCYWVGAWGGKIKVTPLPVATGGELIAKKFRITYEQVPKEACLKFMDETYAQVALTNPNPNDENACSEEYDNTLVFESK